MSDSRGDASGAGGCLWLLLTVLLLAGVWAGPLITWGEDVLDALQRIANALEIP